MDAPSEPRHRELVAIVNEAFARMAGETATLVGRKMTVGGGKRTLTIVGVLECLHDGVEKGVLTQPALATAVSAHRQRAAL